MAEKSFYSRKLGAQLAKMATEKRPGHYMVIFSLNHRWSVVPDGGRRAYRTFDYRKDAIDFAKEKAAKKNGEVSIQTEKGEWKRTISFDKKR